MSERAPVLLVTGGGRGIGAATARLAGTRGFAVAVNYRQDQAAADAVVADLRRAGAPALAVQADVAREEDVVRLFATVDDALGPTAALVNNAGILERQARVADMDAARLGRVFATNVVGAFLCAREAVRRMSTAHGGRGGAIVNVSSMASRLGAPGEYVDYAASKAALDALTIGLSQEVAAEGIRVNTVRAGFIYTSIHASGGEPERVDRVKAFVPMRRGGQPEEVARAVLWLLSDEALVLDRHVPRRQRGPAVTGAVVIAVAASATHSMTKPTRDLIRLVAGLGVEGDAHQGRTVKHRSRVARDPTRPNLRQVHLIHAELHDALRAAGFDVSSGRMGENVTTRGVDLLALPTGTWLHVGDTAVVEVTGLRNPCVQLDGLQPGLMAAVLDRDAQQNLIRKAGVMAIVVIGGDVRPGDPIRVELPAPPHRRLEPV